MGEFNPARQLRRVLAVVFDDSDTLRILLREAVGLDVEVEKLLSEIDETLIGIVERNIKHTQTTNNTRAISKKKRR